MKQKIYFKIAYKYLKTFLDRDDTTANRCSKVQKFYKQLLTYLSSDAFKSKWKMTQSAKKVY